ncbi:NACHT, LRR and PYD domains-containing protein 3-like [Hyperolius riggenbachi]|uniref:NACHT, LRR and PYD domains-containing protein 3-like n=1 Tax=Hyperolius riggenbachi TaxID=752182 RepID=UPI0035A359A7
MYYLGEALLQQILQDEGEHELTELEETHREHLRETTQNLVEHRPPASPQEKQSFRISERFVELTVVSTNQFRLPSEDELIETGVKHEDCLQEKQRNLEQITLNKLFRFSRFVGCEPHAVMVTGVPGVGKTTLMQKFVYDWVIRKIYQRFSYVFFFKFRDLNQLEEVTFEKMILQKYSYLENDLDIILKDPQKLLFIFDGLDESKHKVDFKLSHVRNTKQPSNIGEIVASLVKQSLIKGCYILLTSRPTKLESVDIRVFQRIIEIMGFFSDERQRYFKVFFDNEEFSEKAFNAVKKNDILYTFCYIPSFCWILCTVLSLCTKDQPSSSKLCGESLPKTLTQLFVTFVANILSNHSPNQESVMAVLKCLGRMATYGMENQILVFDQLNLRSLEIITDNYLFSSFLIESHEPSVVAFLHLTVQEFFAALIHYISFDLKKLKQSLEEALLGGRCEIFLRFLSGLSDSNTRSMLKSQGTLSTDASKVVISWLKQNIKDALENKKCIKSKKRLLNLFYCLHETRNKLLVVESIGSTQCLDLSKVRLSPLDLAILAFILESCEETDQLDLESCNVQKEGLNKLVPALHTVKNLSLRYNLLKDSSCEDLASAIGTNKKLKKLDLSNNYLGGSQFFNLAEALSSPQCLIEELLLSKNDLTSDSCFHLVSAIKNNQHLRKIDLSTNKLEGLGLDDWKTALSNQACRLEELLLNRCELTSNCCINLAVLIEKTPTLKKLDLGNNHLAGPHFPKMMAALSNPECWIEELILRFNCLTHDSCIHLASAIKHNKSLRRLDLSGNRLEGDHFVDLITAVFGSECSIEELLLQNIGLTTSSCTKLTELASGEVIEPCLSKLDLSHNNLSNEDSNRLVKALLIKELIT